MSLHSRANQLLFKAPPEARVGTSPEKRSAKASAGWKRLVLAIFLIFKNARSEMVMEYLRSREPEYFDAQGDEIKEKKKHTRGKGMDPETVLRMGIGKPLTRSVAQKDWQFTTDICPHKSVFLRHRAGRGQHWFTCLQCGARWERLLLGESSASSSTMAVPATSNPQGYPKTIPPPRYRTDLNQNVEIKVLAKSKAQMPIPPTKTRGRSVETVQGLRAEQRSKSQNHLDPLTESYVLANQDGSSDAWMTEMEEAGLAYNEVLMEQYHSIYGDNPNQADHDQ